MEASMLGIPAIAMSQVRIGETLHWKTAEKFGADVVRKLDRNEPELHAPTSVSDAAEPASDPTKAAHF